jgi:parallel beta-helix repeat protein
MQNQIKCFLLALAALAPQFSIVRAQGSLTPPGAPAPTMKTLSQIEARTPVDAVNTPGNITFDFYISQPGSYYLTANVIGVSGKSGIGIAANNVTLDLNGFTVSGVLGLTSGIYTYNTCTNVIVRNGMVINWNRGVNSSADIGIFESLVISSNLYGMQCESRTMIRDCTIVGSYSYGIELDGPNSLISGCNFLGNNTANSAGYASIYVTSSGNSIENNHVTGSGPLGNGILIINSSSVSNNIVINNSVEGGGANNYFINTSDNDVGPIGNASTNTSPWANFSH